MILNGASMEYIEGKTCRLVSRLDGEIASLDSEGNLARGVTGQWTGLQRTDPIDSEKWLGMLRELGR